MIAAALFVWLTGHALLAVVASHFGASGAANGLMSRDGYRGFMLALVVALPLIVALSGRAGRRPPTPPSQPA